MFLIFEEKYDNKYYFIANAQLFMCLGRYLVHILKNIIVNEH